MEIRISIAADINHHHQLATVKANEAIHHAAEAGKLLLEVKAALPHGQFGEWMEKSVNVSARQAQRYMAAAQGKPVPIRVIAAKNDTVSYLPAPVLFDEIQALREQNAEASRALKKALVINEMMGRIFDADDRVEAAAAEVKRQTAIADVSETQLIGQQGKMAALTRQLTHWMSRTDEGRNELVRRLATH